MKYHMLIILAATLYVNTAHADNNFKSECIEGMIVVRYAGEPTMFQLKGPDGKNLMCGERLKKYESTQSLLNEITLTRIKADRERQAIPVEPSRFNGWSTK